MIITNKSFKKGTGFESRALFEMKMIVKTKKKIFFIDTTQIQKIAKK